MNELFGKYRAEVIDNNDPDKRGRIQVKCPKVTNNSLPLEWAECCFVPGLFSLPAKGDVVWIEFEEGHVDKPIWAGILVTKEYIKKFGTYDVAKRMLVTLKHVIELNDTSAEFKVDSQGKVTQTSKLDTVISSEGKLTQSSKLDASVTSNEGNVDMISVQKSVSLTAVDHVDSASVG